MPTLPNPEKTEHAGARTPINRLSVLIPVYNSEATIGPLIDKVAEVLAGRYSSLELVLVNDGSIDASHECVLAATKRHPGLIRYVRLAQNFGEHNAVICGLRYITGDCVAIIDDDFQNPPEEIVHLVDKLTEGHDVVYSCYAKKHHSWFRNLGSAFNDRVASCLLKKPRGLYLSSFKVMRAFLAKAVTRYDGPFPYIDGLILRTTAAIGVQECRHEDRLAGRSNYTLWRLVRLWLNMFTGFSVVPLRVASLLGLVMAATGFAMGIFFIIARLTGGVFLKQSIPPGWASLIVCVTFFAGLQLCVLGLIGEYLGRLFLTVNRLPQFIVRETFGCEDGEAENNG